jgi:lysine-specific demethylase 3
MFPELFEDFSKAVPVPNYTRRDGVLNIASHFPTGVIAPDLGNFVWMIKLINTHGIIGPKMYNAFESSENAGGFGVRPTPSLCPHSLLS